MSIYAAGKISPARKLTAGDAVTSSAAPDFVPLNYVHDDVVGLLVLQLLNGRAAEAHDTIHRLQLILGKHGFRQECADLEILWQPAAFDLPDAGLHDLRGSPVANAFAFSLRTLPIVRKHAASDVNPVLSNGLRAALYANRPVAGNTPCPPPDDLSPREHQALSLTAMGLLNKEIAHRMSIQEGTVKKHLTSVIDKLGATNRTQAVERARRCGII